MVEYTKVVNGDRCDIAMKGKFTFADHKEFKSILNLLSDANIKSLTLHFKSVEFIDSAALGILLLARDESLRNAKDIIITDPMGQVKKMFEISRFYELFTIQG